MTLRMITCRLAVCALTMAVVIGLSGCGGSKPPEFVERMVPATGTVTLDGEPLEGAIVEFHPDAKGNGAEVAVGTTDAQGKYELITPIARRTLEESKGAVPGKYRVIIQKTVMPDGSPVPPDTTDADAEADGARQLLPPRYSDLEQTTLTADVESGPSVNDFELRGGR
jgi:hypothetical protein